MARARTLTLNTKVNVTGADKLRGLGRQLQSTGRTLTAGLTLPIVGLGGALVAMAEEADRAERVLENTFESMGAAAWTTTDALKAQQQELQNLTTFGDEEISHLQSVLLTFGNVTGEAFDRATEAALDMSALLGQDLQSSAIQLGKALNNPIQGITALTRVGVSFTEQQKEQIRTLAESGDMLGAQTIILDELERQFGGTAEAMAQTAGGQFKQALNQLGDAGEEFGAIIAPLLADVANGLKGIAGWLRSLNPETKEWVVRIAGLLAVLGPLLIVVGSLVRAFAAVRGAGLLFARAAPIIGASFHAMLGPLGLVTAAIAALAAAFATDFLGVRTRFERDMADIGNTINNFALDFGTMGAEVHRLAEQFGVSFQEMKDRIKAEMEATGDSFDEVVERIENGTAAMTRAQEQAVTQSVAQWGTYQSHVQAAMYGEGGAVPTITSAADDMAEEMGAAPGKMGDALLAAQQELADPIAQLVDFMDKALTPAQERFELQGFLASRELANALVHNNPLIRTKAQEMQAAAIARLAELRGEFFQSGANYGFSFGSGLTDPAVLNFVSGSAARMAAAARGIFPGSEPKDPRSPFRGITKAFGFADIFARGLTRNAGAIPAALASAFNVPSLSPAALTAGGGAAVVNNFYLQWDGESPKGRDEAEIIANLQRLSPLIGGRLAPGF